jgi:hypothetical protein
VREWGTPASVTDEAAANAHHEAVRRRFPEVPSAYQPSGKLPLGGLVALVGGGVLATVAASLTGVLVAVISLGLFALMAFVIAVVAACGFVACILLVWGLGTAVVGGAATFGGLGWVAGAVTAALGKLGKNRNATAAVVVSFLATFAAWAAVASLMPFVATLVPPSTEDFSVGGLVHLFGDYGWVHAGVLLLGLAFALLMAWVGANDSVVAQKFCEPCDAYMTRKHLLGQSFEGGERILDALEASDGDAATAVLAREGGLDLEPSLFACPRCGAGFLEARAWTRAKWTGPKGEQTSEREWLAISRPLAARVALPLGRVPERAPD